jgi:hypothetical protein
MKVIIYHRGYGCDTGCCGHAIETDEEESFIFDHPYGEDHRKWAENLIAAKFGADHAADLDWEHCMISED